jgi:hypothetical protein
MSNRFSAGHLGDGRVNGSTERHTMTHYDTLCHTMRLMKHPHVQQKDSISPPEQINAQSIQDVNSAACFISDLKTCCVNS